MYAPTTAVKRSDSVPRRLARPASTRVSAARIEVRTDPPANTDWVRLRPLVASCSGEVRLLPFEVSARL